MRKLIDKLNGIRLTIFDLDGVIYRGDSLLPYVANTIEELKKNSIQVVYNSNNSTATRSMYVARLKEFGIKTVVEDFYTSASITSEEISDFKENAQIFVIGEVGLEEELKARGHTVIDETDDYKKVDFVIVGLDRQLTYKKIAFGQKCLLEGHAEFYATNNDATLPMDDGLLPGAGVMVKAIELCTSKPPKKIFGKPNPNGIQKILKDHKIAPGHAVIFGDRLDTDIVAGNRAGIKTALVLTGVTTRKDVERIDKKSKDKEELIPDLILESLNQIFVF
jgi:4-nitrophenyl phosphatase